MSVYTFTGHSYHKKTREYENLCGRSEGIKGLVLTCFEWEVSRQNMTKCSSPLIFSAPKWIVCFSSGLPTPVMHVKRCCGPLVVWRCSRIDELFKHLKTNPAPLKLEHQWTPPLPHPCHPLSLSTGYNWLIFKPVLRLCEHDIGLSEPASCQSLDSHNLYNLSEHNTPACLSWRGCSSPPVTATSQHVPSFNSKTLFVDLSSPTTRANTGPKNCIDQTLDICFLRLATPNFLATRCLKLVVTAGETARTSQRERVWSSTLAFDSGH
jgi:hypothetical protein